MASLSNPALGAAIPPPMTPVRVLFVCSRNRLRSPTAEAVVAGWPGVEALSAGTAPDADLRVSADLVAWADLVVCFEARHRRRLADRFGPLLQDKRVVVLGLRDEYAYLDPVLAERLRARLPALLSVRPGA